MFLSKYGVARHIYIPVVKRGVVDFAVSADWTPAAGDVKISKDGGAAANVTNLPSAITMGNTAMWDFSLTATEMQAAQVVVMVADSATKAVEDQSFIVETYGDPSSQHAFDLDTASSAQTGDAFARLGAPAGASTAADIASVQSDTNDIQTRLPAALVSGRMDSSTGAMAAGVLTATAIAAAALNGKGDWNVGKTGYSLTQAFPTNFSALAITAGGEVTAGTVSDKTGYSLTQAFPTNFSAMSISVGGVVAASGNWAVPGDPMTLTAAYDAAATAAQAGDAMTLTAAYNAAKTAAQAGDAMALTSAERNSVADALLDRDMSVGTDSGSSVVRTVRQALRFLRNKWSISAGALTVTKEDDTTTSWTGTVSTTLGADPVTGNDPA